MTLGPTLILTTEKLSKPWKRDPDNYLLKSFRSLTKKHARDQPNGTFSPLGQHLSTQLKTTYLNYQTNWMKLGWFTWSQSTNWWRQVKYKNWHPHHDIPQTCRESKPVCTVWIFPTDNFITHPRTSFRINEWWSNKCNTQK